MGAHLSSLVLLSALFKACSTTWPQGQGTLLGWVHGLADTSACNTGLPRLPGWRANVLHLCNALQCTSTLQRGLAATSTLRRKASLMSDCSDCLVWPVSVLMTHRMHQDQLWVMPLSRRLPTGCWEGPATATDARVCLPEGTRALCAAIQQMAAEILTTPYPSCCRPRYQSARGNSTVPVNLPLCPALRPCCTGPFKPTCFQDLLGLRTPVSS